MILHDVSVFGSAEPIHIHLDNGIIRTIATRREVFDHLKDETRFGLHDTVIVPGFINSHDHLDFNSFPSLGNKIYNDYTEWGRDIHKTHEETIKAVQKIPQHLRVQWGLYKNLLNGFTTVINHGKRLQVDDEVVSIFQDCHPLHSPSFEKNWWLKLNHPLRNRKPFVIHVGEGTNPRAHQEIVKVIQSNLFKKKIVAVHGVAMDEQQAGSFEGLVWCPVSNYFMLNKTAAVNQLKRKTKIVFGTDSTLTASWHATAHFRTALDTGMVTEKELLDMLTIIPAGLWKLIDRGMIKEGMKADLVVFKKSHSLFSNQSNEMLMVIKGGKIRLASAEIFMGIREEERKEFDRIVMDKKPVFVKTGIFKLVKDILSYYPDAVIPFELA